MSSSCSASVVVSIGVHTAVVASASLSLPTCSAGISNNNGTIRVLNFTSTDKYALVAGSSFTGSVTYANATIVPVSGVITSSLANPTSSVAYTVRLFDAEGCTRDTTYVLFPIDCSFHTLGLAKAVSTPVYNHADQTYLVTYSVTVKNIDKGPLSSVVIIDNLQTTFPAPTSYTVVEPPQTSGSGLITNPLFDGALQNNLTNSTSTLPAGGEEIVVFKVKVKTNIYYTPFLNSATGTAKNNVNATLRDSSNAGLDASPPKNVPTPVTFEPYLMYGITKQASFVQLENNSFDITYTVTANNLSNDTLTNVQLTDSLAEVFKSPVSYSIKSVSATGTSVNVNSSYNGNSDCKLLSGTGITLFPGEKRSVLITINILPDTFTVFSNSARGTARYSSKRNPGSSFVALNDISNNGNVADADGNHICNEPSDNIPTIIVIPATYSLFIPEGFSPNDDGINDHFVIKGMPRDAETRITIYNRWGNRVYYHANYSNAIPWDGNSNIAGTAGQGKLPQGTYYYVVEIRGAENKTITGFIVLQY
jgi:gliding motility-associated-like protein/uncharacterized repeat protein (TIGR01451 family)